MGHRPKVEDFREGARFGGRPLLRGDDENQRYGNEQEEYRKEEGLPVPVGEL